MEVIDIDVVDLSWLPEYFNLIEANTEYVVGVIKTDEQLSQLLDAHSRATTSIFKIVTDDGIKRSKTIRRVYPNCKELNLSTHYSTADRLKYLYCQYGKKYTSKSHANVIIGDGDDRCNKKGRFGYTRMVNCPARIYIKAISVYLDYPCSPKEFSNKERTQIGNDLRQKLQDQCQDLRIESFIHIKLPLISQHENHPVNVKNMYEGKTHPDLMERMKEYVLSGILDTCSMRPLIRSYAINTVCPKYGLSPTLSYVQPSDRTIKNCISRTKVKYGIPRKKLIKYPIIPQSVMVDEMDESIIEIVREEIDVL